MTVASRIKQTIASLQGAAASMQNYAAHHPDRDVQEQFKLSQQEAERVVNDLQKRLQTIEFEEPQFKGY